MEPKCINLKKRFGRRFKVEYESSYFGEHGHHEHTGRREQPNNVTQMKKPGCRAGRTGQGVD